jgi:hypothetical protein
MVGVAAMAMILTWASLHWYQSKYMYSTASDHQRIKMASSSSSLSPSQLGRDSAFLMNESNFMMDNNNIKTSAVVALPHWIKSYILWHDQQLRFNASHYSFVVYTCTRQGSCGGIGDRLNGMIQSFYMALCNQRVFLIDYNTPYPLTTTLLPNYIQWNVSYPQDALLLQRLTLMDSREIPSLQEPAILQENQQYRQARGWLIRTNLWMEQTMPNCTCLQKFIQRTLPHQQHSQQEQHQDYRYNISYPLDADDLYRWAFHALFRISPQVMERTRQIQQRNGMLLTTDDQDSLAVVDMTNATIMVTSNSLNGTTTTSLGVQQPYVAMHIRTGHGSSWKDPLRHSGNETFLKFLHCAKHLQQRLALTLLTKNKTNNTTATETNMTLHGSGSAGEDSTKLSEALPSLPIIYVASDNEAIKQQFGAWDNISFRYDHDLSVVHADKTKDPPLESYLDGWAELVILWQAEALVMSVSQFSQVAEVLGMFTNETARYFDQCDDGGNGTTAATPTEETHHYHRDQAGEAFIETRKKKRSGFLF